MSKRSPKIMPCKSYQNTITGSTTVQYSNVRRNTEQFGRVINFRVAANLCRELNFSCAGGRRVLTTRLQNERERLSTNTPQCNIQAVPVNNTLSISNARESFSADQLEQITQITHCRDSCRWTDNYPATANATRKARTVWSIPIFGDSKQIRS